MIRTAALAFLAAATLAAPAFAGSQVELTGKTQAQIRAEVQAVASKLCAEKFRNDADRDTCVAETTSATMRRVLARGDYVFASAD
jgi:hypothetical protein